MLIQSFPVSANLLVSASDHGQTLGLTGMCYNSAFLTLLDWVLTPKVNPCLVPLNDDRGLLLHARNRKAMVKGLRKIYDVKKEDPAYMIDGQGGSVGLVYTTFTHNPGYTKVGAGLKVVGYNMAQAGKRFLAKTAITAKYLHLKTTDLTSNERRDKLSKTTQNMIGSLGIDRYQTLSSVNNVVNEFNNGFYLFVARSKFIPNKVVCAGSVRMMGSKINFGTIANYLERKVNDNQNNLPEVLQTNESDWDEI